MRIRAQMACMSCRFKRSARESGGLGRRLPFLGSGRRPISPYPTAAGRSLGTLTSNTTRTACWCSRTIISTSGNTARRRHDVAWLRVRRRHGCENGARDVALTSAGRIARAATDSVDTAVHPKPSQAITAKHFRLSGSRTATLSCDFPGAPDVVPERLFGASWGLARLLA